VKLHSKYSYTNTVGYFRNMARRIMAEADWSMLSLGTGVTFETLTFGELGESGSTGSSWSSAWIAADSSTQDTAACCAWLDHSAQRFLQFH
jgi:hypothetical protein